MKKKKAMIWTNNYILNKSTLFGPLDIKNPIIGHKTKFVSFDLCTVNQKNFYSSPHSSTSNCIMNGFNEGPVSVIYDFYDEIFVKGKGNWD